MTSNFVTHNNVNSIFFTPLCVHEGCLERAGVLNFWRVYIITTGPVWHVALFWRIIESHGRKRIYKKERKLINNSVVNLTSAVAMKVSKVRKYWKYSVFLKTLEDRSMKKIRVLTMRIFANSFRGYLFFFWFVELSTDYGLPMKPFFIEIPNF